ALPWRLQASMALRITLGHCSSHTLWSYFRPATRYATVLPDTASAVALASSRSALNSSSVAFTRFGERLTCRMRSEYSGRRRDSSRPMTPLAPSTVCTDAVSVIPLFLTIANPNHGVTELTIPARPSLDSRERPTWASADT